MLQNPRINILEKLILPLQIGRTILQLKTKKPWNFFACCRYHKKFKFSSTPKEEFHDYQSLNSNQINNEENNLIKIQEDISMQDDNSEIRKERDTDLYKISKNLIKI